jgi:hypothetical protein
MLAPFFSNSQTNYDEGYVVTATGDTLKGFIKVSSWPNSPGKIFFKDKLEQTDIQTFTPANTNGFSINGYESYSKFVVPVSLNEVSFHNLNESADTTSVTKAVFLKNLLEGDRISLYSYRDDMKDRLYIRDKKQSVPVELIYRKTLKDMQEGTQALFRQQLLKAAVEYGVFTTNLDHLLQTADYSITDVINIITKINSKDATIRLSKPVNKKSKWGFFVGIGLNNSPITHSGKSVITVDGVTDQGFDKYKSSITTHGYSPRFSTGVDLYTNPASRRLIVRIELAATHLSSSVLSHYRFNNYGPAGLDYNYTFSSWNFSFNPQLIYNFYNTTNLKSYVGVGGSLSHLRNNDNSLHSTAVNQTSTATGVREHLLSLKETSMSAVLRFGVQLRQRIDLSVILGNPIEYTNYGSASLKAGQFAVSAAFLLKK